MTIINSVISGHTYPFGGNQKKIYTSSKTILGTSMSNFPTSNTNVIVYPKDNNNRVYLLSDANADLTKNNVIIEVITIFNHHYIQGTPNNIPLPLLKIVVSRAYLEERYNVVDYITNNSITYDSSALFGYPLQNPSNLYFEVKQNTSGTLSTWAISFNDTTTSTTSGYGYGLAFTNPTTTFPINISAPTSTFAELPAIYYRTSATHNDYTNASYLDLTKTYCKYIVNVYTVDKANSPKFFGAQIMRDIYSDEWNPNYIET